MTKGVLPDGVPSDNLKSAAASASFSSSANSRETDFTGPQTAIPGFAGAPGSVEPSADKTSSRHAASDFSRVVVVVEDEEDDENSTITGAEDDDDANIIRPPLPPWFLLVAIAGVLSLLAFYVVNQNTGEVGAYCSQQPAWNQYNCEAG